MLARGMCLSRDPQDCKIRVDCSPCSQGSVAAAGGTLGATVVYPVKRDHAAGCIGGDSSNRRVVDSDHSIPGNDKNKQDTDNVDTISKHFHRGTQD
jgi:hypothetical protein